MASAQSTCWTLIQAAAAGERQEREEFARRYAPVIKAYLAARWRSSPLQSEVDDALQEAFIECYRSGGALQRAKPGYAAGFRGFLFGVVRNVARRFEKRRRRLDPEQGDARQIGRIQEERPDPEELFEKAWARSLMRQASRLQKRRAHAAGEEAQRRVELLELRFADGLPIREIARLWNQDPVHLHREYARARREFRRALLEVVAFHHPGDRASLEKECARLLAIL